MPFLIHFIFIYWQVVVMNMQIFSVCDRNGTRSLCAKEFANMIGLGLLMDRLTDTHLNAKRIEGDLQHVSL